MFTGIDANTKVSIIIPIYNVAIAPFCKCMDSIVNQSYGNIEVILVDDGSTSECVSTCDNYARKDHRVNVFHKKNEGVSVARQFGYGKATGKYVFFADADDYLEPNAIEKLICYAEENNIDIVVGGYYRVIGDVKKIVNRSVKGFLDRKGIVDMLASSFLYDKETMKTGISISLWGKLYKKEVLQGVMGEGVGIKYGEDLLITYAMLKNANSVLVTEDIVYNYMVYPDGIKRNFNSMLKEMVVVWKRLERLDSERALSQQFPYAVYAFCKKILILKNGSTKIGYKDFIDLFNRVSQTDIIRRHIVSANDGSVLSIWDKTLIACIKKCHPRLAYLAVYSKQVIKNLV